MIRKGKQNVKSFLKDYKVAAISSSSQILIKTVLKNIDSNLDIIIEQGAGDGILSKELLKKLTRKGRLILIEQNSEFIKILRELQKQDARIIIFEGLAQDFNYDKFLNHTEKADLIISSIPFSFLKHEDRNTVSEKAFENLKESGKFIIFHQYRKLMEKILQRHFTEIKTTFVLANVLPCFIFVSRK
jgi:phospholipid N-methyltransferase